MNNPLRALRGTLLVSLAILVAACATTTTSPSPTPSAAATAAASAARVLRPVAVRARPTTLA